MSVYFVESQGFIKIGCSEVPHARARQLGGQLLATLPGDMSTEHALHLVFSEDRHHGEWFTQSDRLRAFIQSLANAPSSLPADGPKGSWLDRLTPIIGLPSGWHPVPGQFSRAMVVSLKAAGRGARTSLRVPPGRWDFTGRSEGCEPGRVVIWAKYLGAESDVA